MDHRFKSRWGKNNNNDFIIFDHQKDFGFSWPQRNFMCTFCNKEYKSAQALGGHMNVHRRDRAKLRLSSPPAPLDQQHHQPNPNSNPKCVSPPSPVRYQPYKTYHPSLFPHVSTTNIEDEQHPLFARSGIDFLGCMGKNIMTMEDGEKEEANGIRVWKKTEIFNMKMAMEMEMGLLKDGKLELDLELRLGRS